MSTSRLSRLPLSRIARYLACGIAAFAVDFGLLAALKTLVGAPAWLAAAVAFIVSTALSYLGQKYVTFSHSGRFASSIVRYLVLLAANTCVTAFIVQIFDDVWGLYLLGKVVVTGLTTAWNFPLMQRWVYASGRQE